MATYYVSQSGAGSANGTSEANAWAVTAFNTAGNWSSTVGTSGKISPGDTVILVGTLTSALTVQGSGAAGNKITILFGPGAKMSAANWGTNTAAINGTTKHYITIDGGATGTIGGKFGDDTGANGIIECTNNGTALSNQINCSGVGFAQSNHLTVQGLVIRDIFVREIGSSTLKYGSCVGNSGSAADYTDYTVRNCVLSHAATGIHFDYNLTNARYLFEDNTITNCNWGSGGGNRGSASYLDGIIFRRNRVRSHENWDGTDTASKNALHHNGFYVWGIEGTSYPDNVEVYDNIFGPGWGGHTTGGFFTATGGAIRASIYNNIFLGVDDAPQNGYITAGPGDGAVIRIYNNTFAGAGGGIAINAGGFRSSFFINNSDPVDPEAFETYVYNNLSVNKVFAFFSYGLIATAVDRNLVFNAPVTPGPYATGSADSATYRTFAQWQDLGYDANGIFGSDPLLTETYRLGASSPAIGEGENLSAYFTTDADGNTRPASGAWDIGAYQYGEAPPPTPPAARGRKRRGAKLLSFFR
jgi:hypothetical protein